MLVRDRMSVPPETVGPNADYKKALGMMQAHALHHLPVVDTRGNLVGIVAERDLLIAANHYLGSAVEISEVMHKGAVTVTPRDSITDAAVLMAQHKIGGLPVVDNGKVVGVITETDIFRAFVDMIGQLRTEEPAAAPIKKPAKKTAAKAAPKK